MTTQVKFAVAGLAIMAGAAAVRTERRWQLSQGLFERDTVEASESLAVSTEPYFPDQAAPTRQPSGPRAVSSDFWTFRPARDTFRADSLLDLRKLNEKTAGQSGFVRLSPDKNSFVRGDGVPIRFWAVNGSGERDASPAELAHAARFLAKRGVNLIRMLEGVASTTKNSRITDVDMKKLDRHWRVVAAMKKEGIYTLITPYWAESMRQVPASWNIEGLPEKESPHGLVFYNSTLQQAYKVWLKELLTRKNPYTGIPLGQDPAVAFIQLQNEDGLLWWRVEEIKGGQRDLLRKKFGDWVAAKYGTVAAALSDWGGGALKEDDPQREMLAFHHMWELYQPATGALKKRLDDEVQFLAETMRRFNAETTRYLREELHCRQLINAGNWKTASDVRLNDAERWSYTATEVMAINRYYDPSHIGPDASWRIKQGDQFVNQSVLLNPRALPLNVKQVVGYPMFVTETNWQHPLGYQSEAPFLAAAYQSLTGLDGAFWFASARTEWSNHDRSAFDADSQLKWIIATPNLLGQFPAAALLYRRGDVELGQPVVVEHRSDQELWERAPPIIAEDPRYDPSRDLADRAKQPNLAPAVDPLAFLVGPVAVVYGSNAAKTQVADPSRFIDREHKVVRSNTGQLTWDYGRGFCALDAPKVQGATGFLKPIGPIKLSDVTIRSENAYATVIVISLDDKPLAQSGQVLVQVGTRHRPTGWADHAATFKPNPRETVRGRQVDSTGKMPWVVQVTMVTIELQNPNVNTATLLDVNGNARSNVAIQQQQGKITVELPSDAMYVVLTAP